MEKNEVRNKIYSVIDEIPTLPAVVPKLLSLMEDENSGASDISDAISGDPALASKILKVANSAYYGFAQEVTTLKKAVPLLGFNMIRSLALSIGVVHNLPSENKLSNFSQEGLWIHSLAVATLMQEMGKTLVKGRDASYLFVIGLLHDIGKVVLSQFFGKLFQSALQEAQDRVEAGLYSAERRLIGLDHGEVGAMLLIRWKFPEVISGPIDAHHKTELPEGADVRDVAILRIADALPQQIGLGAGGNPAPPNIREQDLDVLQINEKQLEDLKEYSLGIQDGIYAFFDAMV